MKDTQDYSQDSIDAFPLSKISNASLPPVVGVRTRKMRSAQSSPVKAKTGPSSQLSQCFWKPAEPTPKTASQQEFDATTDHVQRWLQPLASVTYKAYISVFNEEDDYLERTYPFPDTPVFIAEDGSFKLYGKELKCLRPLDESSRAISSNPVHPRVLDALLERFVQRRHTKKVLCYNTDFMGLLMPSPNEVQPSQVKRFWKRNKTALTAKEFMAKLKKRADLFEYKLLIIPVWAQDTTTWFAIVVDFNTKTITAYESDKYMQFYELRRHHLYSRREYLDAVKAYLEYEHQGLRRKPLDASWKVVSVGEDQWGHVPDHSHRDDSGLFVFLLAEFLAQDLLLHYHMDDASTYRTRVALQLVDAIGPVPLHRKP
jgi:hypothetical protein